MNPKTAIGVGVFAALAIGVALLSTRDDSVSVADAQANGIKLDSNVYPAGKRFVALAPDGGAVFLSSSPCAMRPAGADPETCMSLAWFALDAGRGVSSDAGVWLKIDQGDENVMQPGRWVGGGCTETRCAEMLQ